MQSARAAEMPDRQAGCGLGGFGQHRMFADEARQQGVDGNAQPPGLGGKPRFSLSSEISMLKRIAFLLRRAEYHITVK